VDDFHVNRQLAAVISQDHDTDGATTRVESILETLPKLGLVNDRDGLLDITSLSHGNNGTILEIKNTVLLEDWAEHGLDDDTWAWVGDE